VPKIVGQLELEQVVGVAGADIDGDIPIVAIDQQAEMQVVLRFMLPVRPFHHRRGYELGLHKSVGERHAAGPSGYT
jgi:hypothetical protein